MNLKSAHVEYIMSTKQEDFNRLYQLLASLSNKQQSLSEHGLISMISLNDIVSPSATSDSMPLPAPIQDILDGKKEAVEKPTYHCEACLKTYLVRATFEAHIESSLACKQWKELPPDQKKVKPRKALHELLCDWLEEAIGYPESTQCKFCKSTFASRGNHHKHYQMAVACNRLAYLEFQRIISSLNKPEDQLV